MAEGLRLALALVKTRPETDCSSVGALEHNSVRACTLDIEGQGSLALHRARRSADIYWGGG